MTIFLKGILVAFITGSTGVLSAMALDPLTFDLSPQGLKRLAIVALISGIASVGAYLKQSPIAPKQP